MKKVLTLLAVALLLSTAAFAEVGTFTKLVSEANLPAVLTMDNIAITSTFIQKIGDFGELAGLEASVLNPLGFAYTSLKTGIGTILISASLATSPVTDPQDLRTLASVVLPANQLVLGWASGNLGIGLTIGVENPAASNYSWNTSNAGYGHAPDSSSEGRLLIGLQGGLTVDIGSSLDLGLGLSMANQGYETKNHFAGAPNNLASDVKFSGGEFDINAAGRTTMSDMLWVLGIQVALGSTEYGNQVSLANDGNFSTAGDTDTKDDWSSTDIMVGLLTGKTIKATESLKVIVASGLGLHMNGTAQIKHVDNNNSANNTYTTADINILNTISNTDISIPLWVVAEGKLNETWKINAGVETNPLSLQLAGTNTKADNHDKTSGKSTYSAGTFTIASALLYALGVTGKIGDLQLDLAINPAILLSGPYLISGRAVTNPTPEYGNNLAGQIALLYAWK